MTQNGPTVIAGEQNVRNARVLALRSMLGLEIKGLGRRGRSAYSIVKEEFGFKGGKQKVYDQLDAHIKANILPDPPTEATTE